MGSVMADPTPDIREHRPFKPRRGWTENPNPPEGMRMVDIHSIRDHRDGVVHKIYRFETTPEHEAAMWAEVEKLRPSIEYDVLTAEILEVEAQIAGLEKKQGALLQTRDEKCFHRPR
jgi:hypothetical protein